MRANQETLVQIVKEAIGTKGARITTYVSLPGRYMVLLPSAQYVGVSRRIPNDEERSRLRQIAEKYRPEGLGVIVRTAAEGRPEQELADDMAYLVKLWNQIGETAKRVHAPALVHQELPLVDKILRDILTSDTDRLVIDNAAECAKMKDRLATSAPALVDKVHLYTDRRPLFDFYEIEKAIDGALSRKVWLESGGYLIIDRTEALWVIDVNTGKFVGKSNLAETILRTNLEACKEICRQLRLRDMAGIIIIDFIDMDATDDQRKVLEYLGDELKKDRTRTHLVSMTELGLVQLTRKREGKDLEGVLRDTCPICHGRGKVFSAQTIAYRARREVLSELATRTPEMVRVTLAPQAALQFLGVDGEEAKILEKQLKVGLSVVADAAMHPEAIVVLLGTKADLDQQETLTVGQQAKAILIDTGHDSTTSALAVVSGHLVEVRGGAERIGHECTVKITRADRFYNVGEVVRH